MGFFNKYSQTEQELQKTYTILISKMVGFTESEARETATAYLDAAIKEAKKLGRYDYSDDFGDLILGVTATDNAIVAEDALKIQKELFAKKKDGVTDEDVRSWWNLSEVERGMILQIEDAARMATMISALRQGKAEHKAAIQVRKCHPIYGNPKDTSVTHGNDRPLPIELKDRINKYIESQIINPIPYKNKVKETTSFNAFVRKIIEAGDL